MISTSVRPTFVSLAASRPLAAAPSPAAPAPPSRTEKVLTGVGTAAGGVTGAGALAMVGFMAALLGQESTSRVLESVMGAMAGGSLGAVVGGAIGAATAAKQGKPVLPTARHHSEIGCLAGVAVGAATGIAINNIMWNLHADFLVSCVGGGAVVGAVLGSRAGGWIGKGIAKLVK